MSIATEIQRLQTAKTDLKTAIEAKGVTVPSSATIDTYDDYVSQVNDGSELLKSLIDRSITSIEIPSGTTSIGDSAFYNAHNLSSVTMSDTVQEIGVYGFYGCHSLTSVTIPSGITTINSGVFYECYSISNITLPNSVMSLGEAAFGKCSGLTSIELSSGLTSIGNNSFRQCSNLTNIEIPSSVTNIGNYAFYYCTGLTSVTINATTPPALSNANAFSNTNNCPIYVPANSVSSYQSANNWASLSSRIQAIPNS